MRFAISVHAKADADIMDIAKSDPRAAVCIANWLERMEEEQSQDVLDLLTVDNYEDDEINVQRFAALQKRGINVWRLKLTGDEGWLPYRVLYAFDQKRLVYTILRVVYRNGRNGYQYHPEDKVTIGLIHVCEKELGIPRLPHS